MVAAQQTTGSMTKKAMKGRNSEVVQAGGLCFSLPFHPRSVTIGRLHNKQFHF